MENEDVLDYNEEFLEIDDGESFNNTTHEQEDIEEDTLLDGSDDEEMEGGKNRVTSKSVERYVIHKFL